MNNDYTIRLIQEPDLDEVLNIYKYYVDNTVISFEYEAPTKEEYLQRIKTNSSNYAWLVCVKGTEIVGFAYGSTHRYRTAYQWSPESTIYIKHQFHSKGIGKILYKTLFEILKLQGYFHVFAGIAIPNNKSVALHQSLGFEEIGTFKNVGYKLGNWHSTQWFQLNLSVEYNHPSTPKKTMEILDTMEYLSILRNANSMLSK